MMQALKIKDDITRWILFRKCSLIIDIASNIEKINNQSGLRSKQPKPLMPSAAISATKSNIF